MTRQGFTALPFLFPMLMNNHGQEIIGAIRES
jgi:hypothetical protein